MISQDVLTGKTGAVGTYCTMRHSFHALTCDHVGVCPCAGSHMVAVIGYHLHADGSVFVDDLKTERAFDSMDDFTDWLESEDGIDALMDFMAGR